MANLLPPLYLLALYVVGRFAAMRGDASQMVVLDALAFNWLCAEIAQRFFSLMIPDPFEAYQTTVAAYIGIDMTSALWLSLRVKGRCAGIAEIFYLALIIFNVAFFFKSAFSPRTHWVGLSVISWGQLVAVAGWVLRHDLAKAADHFPAFRWVCRHLGFRKKEAQR